MANTPTFYNSRIKGNVFCDTTISVRLNQRDIVFAFISAYIQEEDETIINAWEAKTPYTIMAEVRRELLITGESIHYRIGDNDKMELADELERRFWSKFNLIQPGA